MTLDPSPTAQQAPAVAPAVTLANGLRVPGYLPGMRQPAVLVDVDVRPDVPPHVLQEFAGMVSKALPGVADVALHPSMHAHPLLGLVVRATHAIVRRAGFGMLDSPTVHVSAQPGAPLKLVLPAYAAQQEVLDALFWASDLMNTVSEGLPVESALATLPRVVGRIARHAPDDTNTAGFLSTAQARFIPWRHLYGNVYQYGWGSQARRLESTITGDTSSIGVGAARDKRATALLLGAAGIPVPRHEAAADVGHALRIAARLGYPVVLKPAAQDGGRGVSAGLLNEASVRRAFALAREFSDTVLVETFVRGNDYRVDVLDGEVYGITHRVPAGVVGDGTHSVVDLLAKLNADPRRGAPGSKAPLKRVDLDAEAHEFLSHQAMTADSIPPAGQYVRLRGAANVAVGGLSIPALDQAHPDNLALCVRAARIVGLDVAGIDLLIPDISRSWLETGAAICEVNGKPQLAMRDVNDFFAKLFPRGGRIPVVMVLGPQDEKLLGDLAAALTALGRVGTAWAQEVRIGSAVVSKAPSDTFHAGLALLTDPEVDLAVIGIPADGAGRSGLPVDRFDVLVLAGAGEGAENSTAWKGWRTLALTLAPLCRGAIVLDSECLHWEPIVAQLDAKMLVSAPHGGLADVVHSHLRKRVEK